MMAHKRRKERLKKNHNWWWKIQRIKQFVVKNCWGHYKIIFINYRVNLITHILNQSTLVINNIDGVKIEFSLCFFYPFLFNNKINLLQSIWLIQSMYWSYWQSTEFVRALEIFSYNHYQLNGIKTYILIVINRFQLNSIFIQFSQEHIIWFLFSLMFFYFLCFRRFTNPNWTD